MENAVQSAKKFFEAIREIPEIVKRTASEFGMEIKFHSNDVDGKGKITAFSARYKETDGSLLVTELNFNDRYEVLVYLDDKVEIIHDEPFFEVTEDLKEIVSFFRDFNKVVEINKTI